MGRLSRLNWIVSRRGSPACVKFKSILPVAAKPMGAEAQRRTISSNVDQNRQLSARVSDGFGCTRVIFPGVRRLTGPVAGNFRAGTTFFWPRVEVAVLHLAVVPLRREAK